MYGREKHVLLRHYLEQGGLRAPVSFLYDPLLVRRSEPPARRFVYHLRVRRGCRASLTLHRRRGGCTILFHSLSQSQHPRFLCLRPTLILQGFRVSCTLAERALPCSGLRSIALRPRFFDRPFRDPLRDALRHVVRCDEYRPSRRSNRPTSPGSVHRSASSTIRCLRAGLQLRTNRPAR